jgi:oligopeptide/dipeptide ABC transporter ATP-binding protein
MIAMALAGSPRVLIADEPTTALDVTTQATILQLLRDLQARLRMAIILITHDLGVIAEMADDVVVMYLGRVVESGPVDTIFHAPKHPYTRAHLRSIPSVQAPSHSRLPTIAGSIPHPFNRPTGCQFHPRCDAFVQGVCDQREPALIDLGDSRVRCFLYQPQPESSSENSAEMIPMGH